MISFASERLLSRDEKNRRSTEWRKRMLCAVCRKETPVVHGAGRPRKYCSTACRQRAYRQRREHVGTPHRPAPTRPACGDLGSVIAVVLVPAAECIDQKMEIGRVIELGLLGVTQIHSRPVMTAAALASPEGQETSSAPEEAPDPGLCD
jgi:hypothetical protein